MKACFVPADILLPAGHIDLHKWSVIACDQYTSQPEYWQQVESITGEEPSAYRLIYPEVYLEEENSRIEKIHSTMKQYLREGILEQKVCRGFVLTERTTGGKVRTGLLGAVDLEQYEFQENLSAPIRATEGTVLSRIPPRVRIRENSLIECPHAMLLLEDEMRQLIEPLYEKKDSLRKLYDFELMLGGGHIRGYAVEGADAAEAAHVFARMQEERKDSILAIGDGNHSVAAAKAYWTKKKESLTAEERQVHPARFALAEIVNLYSPAVRFGPIHRIIYGAEPEQIAETLAGKILLEEAEGREGCGITILGSSYKKTLYFTGGGACECIEAVQKILDNCSGRDERVEIDYIHGEENLMELVGRDENAAGIVLKAMEKEELFPIIRKGKVLPRKAFSLGEADEKRYYMECRRISSEI